MNRSHCIAEWTLIYIIEICVVLKSSLLAASIYCLLLEQWNLSLLKDMREYPTEHLVWWSKDTDSDRIKSTVYLIWYVFLSELYVVERYMPVLPLLLFYRVLSVALQF